MMDNPYMLDDAKAKLNEALLILKSQEIELKNLQSTFSRQKQELNEIKNAQKKDIKLRGELNMQRFKIVSELDNTEEINN